MKDLKDMSVQELWELFPITLVEHDIRWSEWATEEIKNISRLLSGVCRFVVHHIGSTAIEGIKSKPAIDLLLETDSVYFADIKDILLYNGYLCMSETVGRISFNKGYTLYGYAERVFHLHLRSWSDTDEVFFRNYLRVHTDVAVQYEALKLSLLPQYKHNRDAYTEAKSKFVRYYTLLAKSVEK